MDRDPDECGHPGQESIDWDKDVLDAVAGRAAGAKYSMFSEGARQLLSEEKQCALFCRGKKCKYCTSDSWATDQKAIHGLYSHWVTENILAMARPSSEAIQTHNIIEQFNKAGIKSVINLQKPGEHASCGGPLHDSGFSYDPQEFMSNYIFFYNFGWPDYGVASLNTILDMVKVMQFAVTQGKVAVHCHAGLGRTGVLIACYLVYTNRMDANEAIHYVRSKRPNAVQTRTQIQCIQEFAQFLKPLRIVFASRATDTHDFTFVQFLNRQKHILHGFEARRLKYLPKIIYTVCERLLELSGCQHVLSRVSTPSSSESHQRPSDDAERTSLLSDSSVSADTLQLPVVGGVHKSASLSDLSHPAETADLSRSCSQQQLSTSQKMADQARIHSLASQIDSDRVEGKTTKGNLVKTMPNGGLKPEECGSFTRSLVAEALAAGVYSGDVMDKVVQYEEQLNSCVETWEQLSQETDPEVLAALMWDWLNHLKEPALRSQDLTVLQDHLDDPSTGVHRLEKGIRFTVEYLMKVMVHLQPLEDALEDRVFETLLSHLTHKAVRHDAALSPAPAIASHWTEIKSSSAKKLFHFFYKYLDIVEDKVSKSTGGKSTNGFGK